MIPRIKFISAVAVLALGACETLGPAPTVTQAERDEIHKGLNFRDQCLAVIKNQPIQSVDPAKDCECVHRAVADLMPAWYVRRTIDYDRRVNLNALTASEMRRFETEISATAISAYRSGGVVP
jgi:hypothetical protein